MGLDYAIDELYSTGWLALDTSDCEHASDGRVYPSIDRVKNEFAQSGHSLTIQHVDLFDCFRAQWADAAGAPVGAVVGQNEAEAAVYALSQFRKRQHARANA